MIEDTTQPCILHVPYLLALDTAVIQAPDGSYWAEGQWARDLIAHMRYLPQLVMLGVVLQSTPPPTAERFPDLGTRFVAVRHHYGRRHFYLAVPRLICLLVREVRRATIVHSTFAYGEGFPYGWIAFPLAKLMGRKTVVTIEGSSWRLFPGERANLKRRFAAWASERITRMMIRHVDYVSYQHEEYRSSLPAPKAGGGVLTQASWISADAVIGVADLQHRQAARAGRWPRLLFASRLVPQKGTRVLAEAIDRLASAGIDLDIALVGEGEDGALLRALDGRAIGRGRVTFHEPIQYGEPFSRFLADFDLLLMPSLGDEQPRIVYDAGAEGVGAIVTDTPGLRSCVVEGESAIIVPRNDPAALADAIVDLAHHPEDIHRLGRGARAHALANTHERMHQDRCRDIGKLLTR